MKIEINYKHKKLSKDKKHYLNYGYAVLKKFLHEEDVKKVKKDLITFLQKNSKNLKNREINFVKNTNLINSIHNLKKWPFIKLFQSQKKLIHLAKYFIGEDVKNFGAELFAKPAELGMASPSHQDNYYWNVDNGKGLTIWISLDKSNSKNGGVYYFEKSSELGLLEHKPSYARGSSQKIKYAKVLDYYKKFTPSLKPGDALIHNCLIIHGSNRNLSNQPRTGLTVRFIGKSSKINPFLRQNYENQLKKQKIQK